MEDLILQLTLVALVSLGASYTQSVTGFGFGIFAMIFLPGIMSLYTEANVLSTILSTLTSVSLAFVLRRAISWRNIIFPLLGCLVSTALAVAFVRTQENSTLTLLLGIALLALSIYFFFFSEKIRIRPSWYAGLIAGVISGIMGGMFSIGGPPVVIYYLQSERDSEHYLATISAYFIFSGLITVTTKAAAGFITPLVWMALSVGAVGMMIGSLVGKLTREKIRSIVLKRAVYCVMALSGAVNIVSSLI